MSLTTLLNSVVEVTKRPDARSGVSLLALNSILMELVTNNDYAQELVEVTLLNPTPDQAAAVISLDLANMPAVRAIEYFTINGKKLRSISPRNALSSSGCEATNVFYRSGNTLVVRSATAFDHARLGYYRRFIPLVEAPGGDQHWMIDDYEPMLVNAVAARTFQATGDDVSAGYYEQLYRDQRQNIRAGLAEGD